MLHVCSLAHLGETVAATGARHVVTLVNDGTRVVRPRSVPPENHLTLAINDIVVPTDGHILAAPDHIDTYLAFLDRWGEAGPLVIHCYAGISRSTAAAFIAACAIAPERPEAEIAAALRRASPTATPNARLVALADARLGRSGRMSAAIAAIGRGADAFAGTPFRLATVLAHQ